MQDNLPPDRPAGLPDDGGWLSGAMAQDRGEFNPVALVALVAELLRQDHGLMPSTVISPTAIMAAADLLRAIGVKPATAPELPRRPR